MNGALLLAIGSAVCLTDLVIAWLFLRGADRADSMVGAAHPLTPDPQTSPDARRRFAHILFLTTPILWLVFAALSFGLLPIDGITAIKF